MQAVPLSMSQLPSSVFAERAWHGVSNKYSFLPTYDVVTALGNVGFHPYLAKQSHSRFEDKRDYTKHLVRFRNEGDISRPMVGNVIPEIVLVNSHDRASSFSLELGLYRLICKNGLVVSSGILGRERVRHVSATIADVMLSASRIVAQFPKVSSLVERMQATQLSMSARENMAAMAMGLRWDADKVPFESSRLLSTRRDEDHGMDLWTTYNVIQENLLRGQSARAWGRFKHQGETRIPRTSSEVKAIDTEMTLNRGLWEIASSHLPYATA
jgi:uncharacterized protein DUF932